MEEERIGEGTNNAKGLMKPVWKPTTVEIS